MHIHTSEQDSLDLVLVTTPAIGGVHICGLYETEEERDEIVFGFFTTRRYSWRPSTLGSCRSPSFLI